MVHLQTCTSASSLSATPLKCISARNAKNVANVIQLAVPGDRKDRVPYCQVCESVDDFLKFR